MKKRIWVCPENSTVGQAVIALLDQCGEAVVIASCLGKPLRDGEHHRCDAVKGATHYVGCSPEVSTCTSAVKIADRPDTAGRSEEAWIARTTIGQVITILASDENSQLNRVWENTGEWPTADCNIPVGGFRRDLVRRRHADGREMSAQGHSVLDKIWSVKTRYGFCEVPQQLTATAAMAASVDPILRGECPGIEAEALKQWARAIQEFLPWALR